MIFADTRYSRQEAIPRLGKKRQRKLLNSSVAVIGAGGVKSPLLFYLAAAGVGRIRIIDFDKVELSNLNRQILYTMEDIGKYKAEAAAARLKTINPEIVIEPVVGKISFRNFSELVGDFNLVFEGGDSAQSREEFNIAALEHNKTFIHASAQYNYAYVVTVIPFKTACFKCIFDDLPSSHGGPVPVIGCATGVAGSIAASEAINILTGYGPKLADRILFFDGWLNEFISIPVERRENCAACQCNQ